MALESTVVTEDTPTETDRPPLMASAFDRALASWSARAEISTVPGDLTSVAAMKASTTGESVLRVCVPAAAAATTPKLAAAAVTTALAFEALSALTVMSPAAYSSLRPVMLLTTFSSVLRPDQARVVVSMVL